MFSARNGMDASILHLFAICNVVKMPLNIIYPKAAHPGVNRDVHNQMLFPFGQIYYPENLDGIINILWTHSSNPNLRGWRSNHFVPCFPDVFDVSSSFDLPHTSSPEEKEVTIPTSQSKTSVECGNSNSTSNKVNDEPMDMADMFTTDKTDKNQVGPSPVLDFSHYINSQDVSEKNKALSNLKRDLPKISNFHPNSTKTREGLQES